METPVPDIPPDIERAQLDEARRRMTEVDSGKVTLIPGDQALAKVRRLIGSGSVDANERDPMHEAIGRDQELSSGVAAGRTHDEVMQAAWRTIGGAE
jgi:hypothetical protein